METTIKSLKDAEKTMVEVNKGLVLVDSTYGKVSPVCFAVSEYLKSDTGKVELDTAKTSAKAWLADRLKVSVNAFYNAVRRHTDSLLTPEEKTAKADKAKVAKAKAKAEQQAKEDGIPADFSVFESSFRLYLKTRSDEQVLTVLAICETERLTRADKAKVEAAKIAVAKAKTKGVSKMVRRCTSDNGSVVQAAV